MKQTAFVFGVAMVVLSAAGAWARLTPAEKCQVSKNKAAGKYAFCRQTAAAKRVSNGDADKYGILIGKCETKYQEAWQKADAKAVAAGASCLDDRPNQPDFKTVIDAQSRNVGDALSGAQLLHDYPAEVASCQQSLTECQLDCRTCGNGVIDAGESCDQGTLPNGFTCASVDPNFVAGTLKCAAHCVFDTSECVGRFVDNGDGTITDHALGATWEAKRNLDAQPNLADPHDADNTYTWSNTGSAPDGTAFTDFLDRLNNWCAGDDTRPCAVNADCAEVNGGPGGACGFAGHRDWRLPEVGMDGGQGELESLHYPAIDGSWYPHFRGDQWGTHWSSTTVASTPGNAWAQDLTVGGPSVDAKSSSHYVRAVRGGV